MRGWLFQYRIKCLHELPVEDQEQLAGAAAFIVSTSGEIKSRSRCGEITGHDDVKYAAGHN